MTKEIIEKDLIDLRKAMALIIYGVYEKERIKKENKYPYSPRLKHGMDMFFRLALKYDNSFDLRTAYETAFIRNYAMKPVSEWFENWNAIILSKIKENSYYYLDALVEDTGSNTYHISEATEDYLNLLESDLIAGLDQKIIYEKLIKLDQEDYVKVRKFIIENPIADLKDLRKFKMGKSDLVVEIINSAYEGFDYGHYVCPRCGWTIKEINGIYKCQNQDCTKSNFSFEKLELIEEYNDKLRLKRGVMKYIADPGKLELEIFNYCKEKKVDCFLWPDMDSFDILLEFKNGKKWAVDAKAVKQPEALRESIANDYIFPEVVKNHDKSFYVIPDSYYDERKDYLTVINRTLNILYGENYSERVECIRLKDLKSLIRKEI
ncbi:hypothetical protein SAMN05216544_0390 [Lachnospira pectinoschiza]|uniref:REase associating with pPIWI RE domain-containing protein n=2 Tax=Lachnospira pectinoschiza TaxID=28052 RepID=A0A1G9TK60_9FIRM|nr:hypothetical protein SAMN05216544_0390 [Lachnospira pectinoschiza]